jgi:AcrR family transcriptional regulator
MKTTFKARREKRREREQEGEIHTSVGDERRRTLIEAAYHLIAERGIGGLRIRDVAAEVGVNNATLHYYFPTKESLILGVVKTLGRQFATTHESEAGNEGAEERKAETPRERMQGYFTDLAYQLHATPERFIVMNELYLHAQRDPEIARALDGDVEWSQYLKYILAEGVRTGEFRTDLDVEHTALSIVAFCKGMPLLINASKGDVDVTVAQFERSFFALALVDGK